MNFIKKLHFSAKSVILLAMLIIVASCSNSGFIVSKKVLDPFTVYSYQPLSLPPIYYLSSQEIADERRFIKEGQKRVQSLLFDAKIGNVKKPNLDNSDAKFLVLANANQDLSPIRKNLDEESLGITYKEASFIDKIFSKYKGEALDDKLSEYKKYNR